MTNTPGHTGELSEASDRELVALVRGGDARAYGVLWSRHAGPAYSVARSFPTLDADDLVSEAFVKVLVALRNGGGPTEAFRPYISMTVRNLARSQFVREPVMLNADIELESRGTPSGEDLVIEGYERSVMLEAFVSLPARWQEVLWHSEVEGLKPREVAAFIGIPANAVSALLIRAKRGLKDAWISAQLAAADSEECRAVIRDLGAFVRDGLSARAHERVEEHLAACAQCRRAAEEARNASHLTLVLLPAVVGVGGVAAYTAHVSAPPLPQALQAMGVEEFIPPSDAETGDKSRKRRHPAGAWVLALLLLVIVSAATFLPLLATTTEATPEAVGATAQPETSESVDAVASPSPPPEVSLAPSETPTPDVADPPQTNTRQGGRDPRDDASDEQVPPGPEVDDAQDVDEPSSVPPLAAPAATLTQHDTRMFPTASGSGARPGVAIELVDDSGQVVGTGKVRSDGTWIAKVVDGVAGTHTIRARQVLANEASPYGEPLSYTTTAPPNVTAPSSGSTVSAASFPFSFDATAGTVVQRQIVGVSSVFTLRMPSSARWNERISVPLGAHIMKVRYADAVSGDFGPWRTISFTAQ